MSPRITYSPLSLTKLHHSAPPVSGFSDVYASNLTRNIPRPLGDHMLPHPPNIPSSSGPLSNCALQQKSITPDEIWSLFRASSDLENSTYVRLRNSNNCNLQYNRILSSRKCSRRCRPPLEVPLDNNCRVWKDEKDRKGGRILFWETFESRGKSRKTFVDRGVMLLEATFFWRGISQSFAHMPERVSRTWEKVLDLKNHQVETMRVEEVLIFFPLLMKPKSGEGGQITWLYSIPPHSRSHITAMFSSTVLPPPQ